MVSTRVYAKYNDVTGKITENNDNDVTIKNNLIRQAVHWDTAANEAKD